MSPVSQNQISHVEDYYKFLTPNHNLALQIHIFCKQGFFISQLESPIQLMVIFITFQVQGIFHFAVWKMQIFTFFQWYMNFYNQFLFSGLHQNKYIISFYWPTRFSSSRFKVGSFSSLHLHPPSTPFKDAIKISGKFPIFKM